VKQLIRGGSDPWSLRNTLRRAFGHSEMKSVSRGFAGGTLPAGLASVVPNPIPPALQSVAETFVELQQARHEADYDLARSFSRSEVTDLIERCETAFQDWDAIRSSDAARTYLVLLLTGERLRRRGP